MKSLIRWSTTLSLMGGILFGSVTGGLAPALALTAEQVMSQLRSVPVFTLATSDGAPLVATPEGEDPTPVAGVFISRGDAQAFLDNLKNSNPQVAEGVQVVPISLADVYRMAQEEQPAEERLRFAFIPAQQQVEAAMSLLREGGQTVEQFQGVPLFIARSGGQEAGYLTVQRDGREIIPIFFNQGELQAVLDRLSQENPSLVSGVSIQVVNLEGLLQTLQSSDNPVLSQILLIPPEDSINFVESLQQNSQQQPAQPNR